MDGAPPARIEELLNAQITWLREEGQPRWKAMHNGKRCELTMNNFPEEPLYTVRCEGESLDIEDSPNGWVISR